MIGIFRRAFSTLLVALAIAGPAAANAVPGPIEVEEFVCPIGQERFSQDTGHIFDPTEAWPDDSRPGDEKVDVIVAECPGNGFVFHPRFAYSPDQLRRAEALIASADYRALAGETRLVRLLWLAPRVGRPAEEQFILMTQASWAARDAAERTALMARIADEGPALIAAAGLTGTSGFRARRTLINAQREIGRMKEAQENFDRLAPESYDIMRAEEDYLPLLGPLYDLGDLIAAGDRSRWPLQIMPREWADAICGDAKLDNIFATWQAATPAEACARHRQRVAEAEAQQANLPALCADLDPMTAETSLVTACVMRDRPDLTEAKAAFAANPAPYVAQCETTADEDRDAALSSICSDYYWKLEDQIGALLADDEAARLIFCGAENASPDHRSLPRGCRLALEFRQDKAVRQMLRDPAALDRQCASNDAGSDTMLLYACFNHRIVKDRALLTDLVARPEAYDALCGYYAPLFGDTTPLNGDSYETRCAVATEIRSNMKGLGTAPDRSAIGLCVEYYIVLPAQGTYLPCNGPNPAASDAPKTASPDAPPRPLSGLVTANAENLIKAARKSGTATLPKDMAR